MSVASLLETYSSMWQFVGASPIVTGATPTVAVPAGYQSGDLLMIFTAHDLNTPAGWTLVTGANNPTSCFVKIATSNESSVVMSGGSASNVTAMLAYRDVSSATPDAVGVVTFGVAVLSAGTQSVNTTQAWDLVLSLFSTDATAATLTPPAGISNRILSNPTASLYGLVVSDELQASVGATAVRTMQASVAESIYTVTIAFLK